MNHARPAPCRVGAVRCAGEGMRAHSLRFLLVTVLGLAACDAREAPPPARPAAEAAPATPAARHGFVIPDTATIPAGPAGASIRRGLALVTATPDSFPGTVRSALRCSSCHLDAGTRKDVMPWVGVAARFPQYRPRSAAVLSLEERVRGCFARSLNAAPPPHGSDALVDIVAYLTWLSAGTPIGVETEGQGLPRLDALPADTARGRAVYVAECARCHGANGEGGPSTGVGLPHATPLWGARSYNIGAGIARLSLASAFIKAAMPYDRPGSLTPQQAYDVAAYVNSRPRPDFPGKELDWPRGDAPADAAYPTRAGRLQAPR